MFFLYEYQVTKNWNSFIADICWFFLQEFLRFILNVTLSDILKLEGDQMMWAFKKKNNNNFWYYFGGVFYDGEM